MKQSRISGGKRNNNLAFVLMLTPFLIFFFLFTILPIISAIVLSFTDFNLVTVNNFTGISHYFRIFLSDKIFTVALRNTLILAIIVGPIGYILSFLLAWLINEVPKSMRGFITLLIYAPSLTSNVFVIWKYIFAADSRGLLNDIFIRLGIVSSPVSWLTEQKYSLVVVAIVTLWMSFGSGFLSFRAGLQSLDRSYYEAAAIDGLHNRWQELFYVTFPQMGPQLMFGAVMSISSAFAVGAVNKELTGFPSSNYSTHTWLLHIEDYAFSRYEMGYASALAVVLFAIMLISWLLVNKVLKRFMD